MRASDILIFPTSPDSDCQTSVPEALGWTVSQQLSQATYYARSSCEYISYPSGTRYGQLVHLVVVEIYHGEGLRLEMMMIR